jgi:hypothetical protein
MTRHPIQSWRWLGRSSVASEALLILDIQRPIRLGTVHLSYLLNRCLSIRPFAQISFQMIQRDDRGHTTGSMPPPIGRRSYPLILTAAAVYHSQAFIRQRHQSAAQHRQLNNHQPSYNPCDSVLLRWQRFPIAACIIVFDQSSGSLLWFGSPDRPIPPIRPAV